MPNRGGEFDGGLERHLQDSYNGEYSVDYSNFFLGLVMDDADDMRMGRVWVYIPGISARRFDEGAKPTYGGTPPDRETGIRERTLESKQFRAGWIECYPMFPFFGSDDFRVTKGENGRNGLSGDPQSYGMSFNPRNGDMVGVLFAFGDAGRAFWMGCMPKALTNQMVPGVPGVEASKINDTAAADLKSKIDPENARIPGMEKKHRNSQVDEENTQTPKTPRYQNVYPASTFANNLLEAGLMCDLERGAGVSSFRRESPSYVIGFKSPGWTYDSEKKNVNSATGKLFDGTEVGARQVGATPGAQPTRAYENIAAVGHQFVMDDHPEYQSVRLRSSAGSQILFNDSANRGNTPYIFINTPKGNVWLEMRDDGGINIFASESVSIHAEKDVNVKADANFNLEVGGDMNVAVGGKLDWRVGGESQYAYNDNVLVSIEEGSLDTKVSGIMALQAFGGIDITSGAYLRAGATEDFSISSLESVYLRSDYNINMFALLSCKITSELSMDLYTDGIMRQSSSTAILINAGAIYAVDATVVALNSGGVPKASRAFPLAIDPLPAFDVEEPELNKVFQKPTIDEIYQCGKPDNDLETVLSRMPQHLPWPGLVQDSSGFGGWVEEETDTTKNARVGATKPTAFKPMDIRGLIGGKAGVWEGQPYKTQSVSEKPVYIQAREFEPGELAKSSAYSPSDKLKAYIKEKEQLRIYSYRDAGKAWAIGYGHNIKVGDTINGITIGKAELQELDRSGGRKLGGKPLIITSEEADALFDKDLEKFANAVRKGTTTEITQGQFDAMTSLSYNIGVGAYSSSTMLRKLNEGSVDQVPHQWMRWINSGGRPNNGLRTRRAEELQQFFNA